MRRILVLGVVLVVAAGVTFSIVAMQQRQQWTTDSEAALEAFLAGLEAEQKLYHADAMAHFQRALELDPDFTIAKLFLTDSKYKDALGGNDARMSVVDEVLATPTEGLSDRERLLIERVRAMREKRPADAAALVDAYLEEHPDDPYVVYIKASSAWAAGELETAERMYRRLVEIDPNWVIAYNQLGYIAMRQGRFAEAEEYFTSYRFVAPDQANPHDSLGELYIIQGRYAEAVASLERALEIRPDFEPSYEHLAIALVADGRFDQAEEVAARLSRREGVRDQWLRSLDCIVRVAELTDERRWTAVADLADDCLWEPNQGYLTVMIHRAAVLAGDLELAHEIESRLQAVLDEQEKRYKWMVHVEAMLDHLRGTRQAVAGDLATAEALLAAADERFEYRDVGAGMFKLFNRLLLVEVRFAAGRDAEAHRLLSQVRHVNPVLVEEFEEDGLRVCGLERR